MKSNLKGIVQEIINTNSMKLREMARISTTYKIADGISSSKFGLIANRIFDVLKDNPNGLTQQDIAAKLNYPSHQHINPYMRKMFDSGEIEKIGLIKPKGLKPEKIKKSKAKEEPEEEIPYKPEPKYIRFSAVENPEEDEPEIQDTWDSPEEIDIDIDDLEKNISVGKSDKELASSKDELTKLIKQKDKLVADLKAKKISMDEYKKLIGNIPDRIKTLQSKLTKDEEDEDILFEEEIDSYSRLRYLANLR